MVFFIECLCSCIGGFGYFVYGLMNICWNLFDSWMGCVGDVVDCGVYVGSGCIYCLCNVVNDIVCFYD